MSLNRKNDAPSKTAVVRYEAHAPAGTTFDDAQMDELLERARVTGVISQFDTGRGHGVWFEGTPGEKLRDLHDEVLALLAATASR